MSRLRFAARAGTTLVAISIGLAAFVGFGQANAAGTSKADATNTPPGNKGTVKVDDESFDGIPDNDPHPGCTFYLQFFFFPRATTATYEFAMHPPTRDGKISGSIPLDPTTKPNAERLIDLTAFLEGSGVAPQPQQGWHVKLTIHAPGAQGADVKHKVFWVNCQSTSPSPSVSPTVTVSPSPTVTPTETVTPSPSVTPTVTVSPTVTVTPTGSTSVSPTLIVSPTPSTSVKSVTISKTGSDFPARLVVYSVLLVIVGSALVVTSRRRTGFIKR